MTIDPRAADGFSAGADAYEQARPSYPPEAVAELDHVAGLGPGRRVLDLAAGTGKLTRLLAARPDLDVVAVEPVAEMRATLAASCPDVEVLDGTAETIPLPDASVDAVTVAQAFHWFDPPTALAELHRVLRPGGTVVLLWNTRDRSVPWVAAWDQLLTAATPSQPFTAYHEVDWLEVLCSTGRFADPGHWSGTWADPMDVERLVARAASVSVVATLAPMERQHLLDSVRTLAHGHPDLAGREPFGFPYITSLWWAHRV